MTTAHPIAALGLHHRQTDYAPLVKAALGTALVMLLAKAGAVLAVAPLMGAPLRLRLLGRVLPYYVVESDGATFGAIVTTSTIVMAGVAALLVLRPALAGGWRSQTVWGRGLGAVIATETLVLEVVRNRLKPPAIVPEWLWIACAVAAAAAVLLGIALHRSDHATNSYRPLTTSPIRTESARGDH